MKVIFFIIFLIMVINAIRKAATQAKQEQERKKQPGRPQQSQSEVDPGDLEAFLGRRREPTASVNPPQTSPTPPPPQRPQVSNAGEVEFSQDDLAKFLGRRKTTARQPSAAPPPPAVQPSQPQASPFILQQTSTASPTAPTPVALSPQATPPVAPSPQATPPVARRKLKSPEPETGTRRRETEIRRQHTLRESVRSMDQESPLPLPARLTPLQKAVLYGEIFGRPGGRRSPF